MFIKYDRRTIQLNSIENLRKNTLAGASIVINRIMFKTKYHEYIFSDTVLITFTPDKMNLNRPYLTKID
jgi:hypothetical protein